MYFLGYNFQMTSDRISCEVSKSDQARLGPSTTENDTTNSTIPTNCANLLKPEGKLTVTRPLSHTPVTSNPTPFKCPLQRSSTVNIPSGKFSLAFLSPLRCFLFLFFVTVKNRCTLHT